MLSSIEQQFDLPTNRLYTLRDELRRKKRPLIDLISGNVNDQGILFPPRLLAEAMKTGMQAAKIYRPDPLGQKTARIALSQWYAGEGLKVPPEQLVLTPGTSLSYWYAFKLLADQGDEILCPTPSYPLFDSIASLAGIKLTSYRLREEKRWSIDMDQLESAITSRTKAIILISPHNPTGAVATWDEIAQLGEIATRRNLAIISDEVFSPFIFTPSPRLTIRRDDGKFARPALSAAPLVITLNGFSKMLALPGMKIGWMAVTGEPSLVTKSLKTLEMISDTFLPVHEMAQFAAPGLLKEGRSFERDYVLEIRKRMDCATKILSRQEGISFTKPGGGFFLTLRLEGQGADEEEVAYQLLKKHGVLVHPGYFYDMEGQHLVLSFVSRPAVLRGALNALLKEIGSH